MSRMSDLWINISEMLERGVEPDQVSTMFHVPIEWVIEAQKEMGFNEPEEEYE